MKLFSTVTILLVSGLGLFFIGCGPCPEDATPGDQAVVAAQAELSSSSATVLEFFDFYGVDLQKRNVLKPLVSERVFIDGNGEQIVAPLAVTIDAFVGLVDNAASDAALATEQLQNNLVSIGKTTQLDSDLDQPRVRYAFIELGNAVGNLRCVSKRNNGAYTESDKLRCAVVRDLGDIHGAFDMHVLATDKVLAAFAAYDDAFKNLTAAVVDFYSAATAAKAVTPALRSLGTVMQSAGSTIAARTTPSTSFGSMVRNGVATGAGAAAGAASLVIQNETPSADIFALILSALSEVETGFAGITDQVHVPDDQSGSVIVAKIEQVLAEVAGNATASQALLDAALGLQGNKRNFNLQYQALTETAINANRQFPTVSNVLKTKHDTAKNSVSNIR